MNYNYLFCIGLGSALLTLIGYPGVLYSDSYQRWDTAKNLTTCLSHLKCDNVFSWVSITPQFFMSLFYLVPNSIAMFTFIQAFLFFISSFLILDRCLENCKVFLKIIFCIIPIFYGYSIFHEMSVGFIIGFNFGLLLLFDEKLQSFIEWSFFLKFLYFFGLFVSFYIAFGFRQNSFTLLPVITIVIFYLYKKYRIITLCVLQLVSVSLSLVFVVLLPGLLKINIYNSSSAGFVWEILTTIQSMPAEKQLDYKKYLDFISKDGDTYRALLVNNTSDVNSWLWDVFTISKIGDKSVQKEILLKYFILMIDEPKYFIKNKIYFIGRSLGVQKPLKNLGYIFNYNNGLVDGGLLKDDTYQPLLVNVYNNFQDYTLVFLIPWFWFLLGMFSLIYKKKKGSDKINIYTYMYICAVSYYAAFLINTQSFEFRYFFPSFYMLFIITVSCFGDFMVFIKGKIKFYFSIFG